jgi:hypothetical protein
MIQNTIPPNTLNKFITYFNPMKLAFIFLPSSCFYLLYAVYLHYFYKYTPHTPLIYKNWGYVLAVILVVIQFIRASSINAKHKHSFVISNKIIALNMLLLLLSWLVLGNVASIALIIRDFRYAMIDHIFIIFIISLFLSKLLTSLLAKKAI